MSLRAWISEPCPACGVPAGAACKTSGDARLTDARGPTVHRERRRLVLVPAGNAARARNSFADVDAVRFGQLTVQEESMRGDELDAWRVAIACACLARVQGERARPVVRRILSLCPRPFVALQRTRFGHELADTLSPLGLARVRLNAISRLSIAQLHDRAVEGECALYGRESIRLFVLRDLSFVPQDKVLKAARARVIARGFDEPWASAPPAPG